MGLSGQAFASGAKRRTAGDICDGPTLWNLNRVAGLILTDSFGMRCGLTKRVVIPSIRRSSAVRLGARRRVRLLISSNPSHASRAEQFRESNEQMDRHPQVEPREISDRIFEPIQCRLLALANSPARFWLLPTYPLEEG
jgi:hypothetical protein